MLIENDNVDTALSLACKYKVNNGLKVACKYSSSDNLKLTIYII